MNPGDKVVWYKSSKKGKVVSVHRCRGIVKSVAGGIAVITTASGGQTRQEVTDLLLEKDDSPEGIFERASSIT